MQFARGVAGYQIIAAAAWLDPEIGNDVFRLELSWEATSRVPFGESIGPYGESGEFLD
ncbi:hypothetical protein HK44_000985 [Pseudomonas fluorescens HK44]|uniref:Uncharacterized protein n=1 Tax=Pseudomonas fluorescens HK44 TaxID=1042209 RepID=A0A010TBJ3_PSEFL|nr:hypothetical protein HK44_000985 [Pseudomonas fluorescens HK44]